MTQETDRRVHFVSVGRWVLAQLNERLEEYTVLLGAGWHEHIKEMKEHIVLTGQCWRNSTSS